MNKATEQILRHTKENDPLVEYTLFSEFAPFYESLSHESKDRLNKVIGFSSDANENSGQKELYNLMQKYKNKTLTSADDARLYELFCHFFEIYSPKWLRIKREDGRVSIQLADRLKKLEWFAINISKISRYRALIIKSLLEPESMTTEELDERDTLENEFEQNIYLINNDAIANDLYETRKSLRQRLSMMATWKKMN